MEINCGLVIAGKSSNTAKIVEGGALAWAQLEHLENCDGVLVVRSGIKVFVAEALDSSQLVERVGFAATVADTPVEHQGSLV